MQKENTFTMNVRKGGVTVKKAEPKSDKPNVPTKTDVKKNGGK